jgi:integrase
MPGVAFIRERKRKDGSAYFSVTYRLGGRGSRQSSTSFPDQKEAKRFCALVDSHGAERALELAGIADTQRPSSAQTVAEYLDGHVAGLSGVHHKTVSEYKRYVRNDISPSLGAIPLSKLTRDDIAGWVNAMRDAGAAGGTIQNKHGFLSGALKRAVENGQLAANPCEGVKLPRTVEREMIFLTPDEFKILKAAFSEHYQPLVEFLVVSGCRASEALALQPSDVNRETGEVRINKAWHRGGPDGYYLGPPKSRKSTRTINVPKSALAELDYSHEWLFVSTNGKPIRLYSWRANVWYDSLRKAQAKGLKKSPRIHDLRHTCASWMIQKAIHPRVVQEHLGHESIQTTMGTYGHVDRTSHVAAADAIADMLV